MRLLRILSSPINPFASVPEETRLAFINLVEQMGGIDIRPLQHLNSRITQTFTQTMRLHSDLLEPLELPITEKRLSNFYRSAAKVKTSEVANDDSSQSAVLQKNTFMSASPVTPERSAMILSSS